MIEQPVKIHRKLTDVQKKRINEHKASVKVGINGQLEFLEKSIITPTGKEKINKLITIVPEQTEKVTSFAENPFLFRDLRHMNLILTNACNLNCTYCYEQHNTDFGRFTNESLLESYNWFKNINQQKRKVFQFFGGEPLIHRPLIHQFIEQNHDYLNSNYDGFNGIMVSICSNGILLNDEFIDFYFSKKYTSMLLSLDTLDIDVDHREITKEQQQHILHSIDKIIATLDNPQRLIIRCTLSEETAPGMTRFLEELYEHGVRNYIVHPLVLDSMRGFISWEDKNWDGLRDDIFSFLDSHQDCHMKFSEGVGLKEDNNCMVGSDMIAIDGSGDFSGCYFFTNMKATIAGSTILGNILNDRVYVERYKTFQKAYQDMFDSEEQCKTCDYQQACYQCPAGNLDTGSKLFRPDDMCQKIVKLYLDFQKDVSKKIFNNRVKMLYENCNIRGEDAILNSQIAQMAEQFFEKEKKPIYYLETPFPSYKKILGNWLHNIKNESFDVFDESYTDVEVDTFFKTINTIPTDLYPEITDLYIKCFYIQCISILLSDENRINEVKLSTLLL